MVSERCARVGWSGRVEPGGFFRVDFPEGIQEVAAEVGVRDHGKGVCEVRHGGLGAVNLKMPEAYRKQTLGYLAREEPRAVLGLPENYQRRNSKRPTRRPSRERARTLAGITRSS